MTSRAPLCLMLFFATLAFGKTLPERDDQYIQTVWTTDEGLPQNSVTAILQSRDGYLWLGTFGGLARFDGVKFTTFNTGNTPGLKSNRILSLCEARDGTLWIGTDSGEVMSFKDGAARTYAAVDGLPGGFTWAVREDRSGTLWAATSNGLVRFQGEKFKVYTVADGLPDNRVWSIDEDEQGRLWFGTNGGIVEMHQGQFTVHRGEAMPEDTFVPIYRRREGGYWVGARNALADFSGSRFRSHPDPKHAPLWKIYRLLEDSSGNVWISYFSPIIVRRYRNGQFSSVELKSPKAVVRAIFEDREGNIWIGSDGGGLTRLKRRTIESYTTAEGLPSDSIRSVVDDGEGGVWIATSLGLVHLQSGKITTFSQKDGLLSYDVLALHRNPNALWIGTNYGLTRYKAGRFTSYTESDGLPDKNVRAIAEDQEGNLWIGTSGGLTRFHNGRFTTWRTTEGLIHNDIRFILPAKDGGLWIGTTGGLSLFRHNTFTNYSSRDGLSNEFVRDIVEETDGTLWLATYGGGLNRFRHGKFVAITSNDGLFDDFISRILKDGYGNFWFLGNRGIFKLSWKELNDFADKQARSFTQVSYGTTDGMAANEGNGGQQPAGWRSADGTLWFPTIKGIVAVDPLPVHTSPAPVLIEQVSIDRIPQPAAGLIELRPGQENLEIHYTGLSFRRSEQVRFRFQLVGLDKDWVDAGTRRTAYYSYLPPGEYVFKVIADNGDGVWNTEGRSLRVIVVPPFYRTWWFTAIPITLVLGALIIGFRYRVRQLRRRTEQQEAFSRRLMESQESERKRIAAELHDSLGQQLLVIKNWAMIAIGGIREDSAREPLGEISTAASQAIDEVREIIYDLRPYQLDKIGLTSTIQFMTEKISVASGIRFDCRIADINGALSAEAEITFYRVMQEAINNIVKHSQATEAKVSIERRERAIEVTIEDNGRGFSPGDLVVISKRGGFGMTGMSERIRMLGGRQTVESQPGSGTRIQISLPL